MTEEPSLAARDPASLADHARHLAIIARDVRSNGDAGLVVLSEDGVTPHPMTLADELFLIAYQLDPAAAMSVGHDVT